MGSWVVRDKDGHFVASIHDEATLFAHRSHEEWAEDEIGFRDAIYSDRGPHTKEYKDD